MHFTSTLLYLAPLTAAASIQLPPRDAPANLPQIASVQYSGTGCPSSAPAVDASGAWNNLAFQMNAFEVTLPASDTSTANCEVHVQTTDCSTGWQFGIKDVSVEGWAVLDPGVELDFYVQTFWSQEADNTVTVHGSLENTGNSRSQEVTTVQATIPDSRIVWSPCSNSAGEFGGILNVNFRAALHASGSQYGYFGKGSETIATEKWSYVWRQC